VQLRLPDQRWLDAGIAAVVATLGQIDAWGPTIANSHISGSRPAVSAFYALTALALVFRRRHPLAVLFFIAAVDLVQFVSIGASAGNGALLPGLVAGYSVGAYCDLPAAYAGVVAAVAIGVGHELANPNLPTGRTVVRASAWNLTFVAAWLLGAYLRTRRLYVAELRDRAARAEHEREERARRAVADERARIARELHDSIAHGVSVMVVQAEAAEEVLIADPPAARGALHKVQGTGREALGELRRLVGILRSPDGDAELVPQPGIASLDRLVDHVRDAGLPTEVRIEGEPRQLPPGIDLSAYRIVQEALTNVLKHAQASLANVVIGYTHDSLMLEITDDGRGAGAVNGSGHGLTGMRERVALYDGELQAATREEGGFLVRARLPVAGG
jgi:signal transduction histidine kinase